MTCTIKDAMVKRYHYATREQLQAGLKMFMTLTTTPAQDSAWPHIP